MTDAFTTSTEIGYITIPANEIIENSGFLINPFAASKVHQVIQNAEWSANNNTAVWDVFVGTAGTSLFSAYVANTAQDSKEITWQTVSKTAVPYLGPLAFGSRVLDDIVRDPEKYTQLTREIQGHLADFVEGKAITALTKGVSNYTKELDYTTTGMSVGMFQYAISQLGKHATRPKSIVVHPVVAAKIRTLAKMDTMNQWLGCDLVESAKCPVDTGVYTSYIAINGVYQWALPADGLKIEQKSERGKLEKFLDVSFHHVDICLNEKIGNDSTNYAVVQINHTLDQMITSGYGIETDFFDQFGVV